MKFRTTISCPDTVSVREADEITEIIRELGYPGDGWKRDDGMLKWSAEFEGSSLDELCQRYYDTRDSIDTTRGHGFFTWAVEPDNPIDHLRKTAKDVLEWEKHFEGVDLPLEVRDALNVIAGNA